MMGFKGLLQIFNFKNTFVFPLFFFPSLFSFQIPSFSKDEKISGECFITMVSWFKPLEGFNFGPKIVFGSPEYLWRLHLRFCTLSCPRPHSAHQAIMRTNLLKEELEELKITVNALEERKSMTESQNKQLVSREVIWNGHTVYILKLEKVCLGTTIRRQELVTPLNSIDK